LERKVGQLVLERKVGHPGQFLLQVTLVLATLLGMI